MRVLHVGAFPFPSHQGSQVLLAGSARALAALGHEVHVVTYGHGVRAPGTEPFRLHRAPRLPGYQRLRSGPDPYKPFADVMLAQTVRRVVRACGIEVVHAHNHEALLASALALGVRRACPLVYGEHTLMAEELPTYAASGRATLAALGAGLDRLVVTLSDGAVALSVEAEARLRRGLRQVVHAPPGVEPGEFGVARAALPSPGRWLVYSGTPDRFQDTDCLPAVMRGLPDWGLLWLGRPPAWRVPRMLVREGSWAELAPWLAAADVAILPRRLCAGFPLKLLNYAMLGLPTAVAHGSARGVPGEHPCDGSVGALIAAVVAAASAPRPRREQVLADWSWPVQAARLASFYEAVTNSAAGA